jgi:hypothetical protein
LSAVALTTLAVARVQRGAALNGLALTRGRWAAEGCLALLQAAVAQDSVIHGIDSTDLGGGTWCRATVEDPDARLTLDQTPPEILDGLLGDHALTSALLDWTDADDLPRDGGAEREWYRAAGRGGPRNGPIAGVDELLRIAGFDSTVVARVRPFVTTSGTGHLAVNVAPPELLELIPGFDRATVAIVLRRRGTGRPFRDLDDLVAALPTALRTPILVRYAELRTFLSFTPSRLLVHLEGHVPEAAIVATPTLLVVPVPGRLAILHWEAL